MFKGNHGRSAWNSTTGNFDEVDSTFDPVSGLTGVPFDYGTEAEFLKKVDLSVAGNIMDCGECHVGGGAMEYVPNNDLSLRTPLVDLATTGVPGFGGCEGVTPPDADGNCTDPITAPITAANYTAFNYFIDNYDVDGDAATNPDGLTEIQYIDYADAGVMEMDCFMCHLPGYEYEARRDVLRKAKLGALASIGSGLATENALPYGAPNFGTTVVYDAANPAFETLAADQLGLTQTWAIENLAGKPDSTNCANCHANEFSVDWKKRGDHWAPEGQYDFAYEVHYNIGCMGCHERDTATPLAWQGADDAEYSAMAPGSLGHDPAKGMYAQYSGLYNKNDNVQFKDCVDCHINGTEASEYGAPNPNGAHAAYGLTALVAQGNTADGIAKTSHIDMMHCSACHSRKINSYDWGNTGAPLIDATGADHEKRLTDHENTYVTKPDMTDQTSLQWFKGKLRRVQPSATMFWRDKNDTPALDANFDGRPHGMDALLMTDVLAVNNANGWGSITEDTHGVVTQADFASRITELSDYINTKAGVAAGTAKIKFSVFHVNFANQHGVSPSKYAWGSGAGNDPLDPADDNTDTCLDCHDANSNFYNGTVDTTGPTTLTYAASTAQRVPFTKVNGFSQPTDWHPNQFDKFMKRSIAVQIANTPDPVNGGLTTRDVTISENMYENAFMTEADYAPSYTSSGDIDFTGFEKGWTLMVQSRLIDTDAVTPGNQPGPTILRTKTIGIGGGAADVANVTELISSIGSFATDFEFTIASNGTTGITITADPNYEVKLAGGVDNSASFMLSHAAYKAATWTAVDGSTHTGRASWVAYLDGIDSSDLSPEPVAAIASVVSNSDGTQIPVDVDPADGMNDIIVVRAGEDVTFNANVGVNPPNGYLYRWWYADIVDDPATPEKETVGKGATVVRNFKSVGLKKIYLRVIAPDGTIDYILQKIWVKAAAVADTITIAAQQPAGNVQSVQFDTIDVAHDQFYIIWGDGTKERIYAGTDVDNPIDGSLNSITVDHQFKMYSKYINGDGNYEYKVNAYIFDGARRVQTLVKRFYITP